MPRARWFVVGFLLVTVVLSGVLNERGPFAAHPVLGYQRLLNDVQAGEVAQIVQWRDQLEVTEQGTLLSVTVPPGHDLTADLAQARAAGSEGISLARIPDAWLGLMTPWVPLLLTVGGALIWGTSLARNRRSRSSQQAAGHPGPVG